MKSVLRLFSLILIALALAVFPADAQTPDLQRGFKAGYVATLSSGEVAPEQMESFKERTKRVLTAMAEKEPGTLMFEFSVQPDGKTVDLLEVYQNAEAFVAHVKHMRAKFKPEETPESQGKQQFLAPQMRS